MKKGCIQNCEGKNYKSNASKQHCKSTLAAKVELEKYEEK